MPQLTRAALGAVVWLVACSTEPAAPALPPASQDPHSETALQMHVRIDGRDYVAAAPGGFAIEEIEINKGGIRLSATFRNAGDESTVAVNAIDYQLTVAGTPDGGAFPPKVEYTRTDAFSGTLYWVAPGQSLDLWVGLLHLPTQRHLLGPFPVGLQRRSHDGGDSVAFRR